ncbi:MAG: hypothetical protein KC643_27305 [Nitrospira sp.]|nr:hypothetical protein [Nitrospira sp.]
MSSKEDQWAELATGKVSIGTEKAVPIEMSRWHWRLLSHLQKEMGRNVAFELDELRQYAPDVTAEQLVKWYVELSYEAILGSPEEEIE